MRSANLISMVGRAILVSVAALTVGASAGAVTTAFKNNVCKFVSSKAVTAIAGMSGGCTEQPATFGSGDKVYSGIWGVAKPESVQITIEAYSDQSLYTGASHYLNQAGLTGNAKKVSGIGVSAYETKDSQGVEIRTAGGGKYIVVVILTNLKTPPSPSEIEPLAKAVIAAL